MTLFTIQVTLVNAGTKDGADSNSNLIHYYADADDIINGCKTTTVKSTLITAITAIVNDG